jgi:hypothetical protein
VAPNSSPKHFCFVFKYCRLQSHSSIHSDLTTKKVARKLISPSLVVVVVVVMVFQSDQVECLQLTGPEEQDCNSDHLLNHVYMQ